MNVWLKTEAVITGVRTAPDHSSVTVNAVTVWMKTGDHVFVSYHSLKTTL